MLVKEKVLVTERILVVTATKTLKGACAANPERLWRAIGDFTAIADWHPAVETLTLQEAGGSQVRVLGLVGGGEIQERLESRDDAAKSYSYVITSSPLPITNYRAILRLNVISNEEVVVTWSGKFKAAGVADEEAQEIVGGIYEAGLAGIAEFVAETAA